MYLFFSIIHDIVYGKTKTHFVRASFNEELEETESRYFFKDIKFTNMKSILTSH